MIKGIDISTYQGGSVDFHCLKNNLDFVFIRSTYGNGYIDSEYVKNREGARAAGLSIGYYHFAYPQYNTPEDEATWFTKTVSCQPGEVLALDFEEPYSNPVDWCKRFLDKCTSNMGFKPLLYINLSTVRSFDWSPVINAGYGLWLAYYDGSNQPVLTPWPVIAAKQYADNGNVCSLSPVDLDVFFGDVSAFKKYGNPPPATPTPIPEPTEPPTTPENPPSGIPTPPTTVPPALPPQQPPSPPQNSNWLVSFLNWLLHIFR